MVTGAVQEVLDDGDDAPIRVDRVCARDVDRDDDAWSAQVVGQWAVFSAQCSVFDGQWAVVSPCHRVTWVVAWSIEVNRRGDLVRACDFLFWRIGLLVIYWTGRWRLGVGSWTLEVRS